MILNQLLNIKKITQLQSQPDQIRRRTVVLNRKIYNFHTAQNVSLLLYHPLQSNALTQ